MYCFSEIFVSNLKQSRRGSTGPEAFASGADPLDQVGRDQQPRGSRAAREPRTGAHSRPALRLSYEGEGLEYDRQTRQLAQEALK